MSLDKAIQHLKEHRKPYRKAKAIDKTCRNHSSDDWATSDRLIQPQKELAKAEDKLNEYIEVQQTKPNYATLLETDDWAVEFDTVSEQYRVSYFEHGHWVDECKFPAYKKEKTK